MDIVKEQRIMILLAYLNHELPTSISPMFRYYEPINTRLMKHFFVPFVSKNYRAFSLSYCGPKTWNDVICEMFDDIEDVPKSKVTLKRHVRKFLVEKYLS